MTKWNKPPHYFYKPDLEICHNCCYSITYPDVKGLTCWRYNVDVSPNARCDDFAFIDQDVSDTEYEGE